MLPDYLSEPILHSIIEQTLAEDLGTGDVTTLATIPETTMAHAHFVAKSTGILAGLLVAEYVFRHLDTSLDISWTKAEGQSVHPGEVIGHVQGLAHPILSAERLALNFMQRMSGIASLTHRMVQAVHPHPVKILDTRKTVPGLRLFDKWAVRMGGGHNHRIGLYDMILIKDNHIASAGGLRPAIEAAHRYRTNHVQALPIEVETTTLEQVKEVVSLNDTYPIDRVMLDNMTHFTDDGRFDTSLLQKSVAWIDGCIETEASGNVTEKTVAAIAATGVDAISSGALTHSVSALDISLQITLDP